MSFTDVIHYPRHALAGDLPKSWWLLPSILIGTGVWSALIYAIIT